MLISNFIYKCQDLEAIKISFSGEMDKKTHTTMEYHFAKEK